MTDLPGTNAGAPTSSVKHATPSGHSLRPNPPFRLIPKTLHPRVTDERKKIPTWNLLGGGSLGSISPPVGLACKLKVERFPNLNMVVVQILVVTKKFTGRIILPKKDNYPKSPHVERCSLSHLNCSYLCEISRNDESTNLLDSFTNFNFDFQCFWGFLES